MHIVRYIERKKRQIFQLLICVIVFSGESFYYIEKYKTKNTVVVANFVQRSGRMRREGREEKVVACMTIMEHGRGKGRKKKGLIKFDWKWG